MKEPLFYAEGLTVRQRSVTTDHKDGRRSSTLGFIVCECSPWVDGAAELVAKALNALPEDEQ